jgi:hypothetical protein
MPFPTSASPHLDRTLVGGALFVLLLLVVYAWIGRAR